MDAYKPKLSLEEFIEGNELNNQIYGVLMDLQDGLNVQYKLKKDIVYMFNKIYEMCHIISTTKYPEQYAPQLWNQIRCENLSYESSIIFSAVYVILYIRNTPELGHCLRRIRTHIDPSYFAAFEPILNNSLAYTDNRTLPADFAFLKSEGDKITDLNERELFYQEYKTRYKQAQNQGDVLKQIEEEINLIEHTKTLSTQEEPEIIQPATDTKGVSGKIKTIVVMELLKQFGKGKANNDLTAICRLVSFLSGQSEKSLYNEAQKGIVLTSYHNDEIKQANEILYSLNICVSIEKDKDY